MYIPGKPADCDFSMLAMRFECGTEITSKVIASVNTYIEGSLPKPEYAPAEAGWERVEGPFCCC
jgi:hypothetical protein